MATSFSAELWRARAWKRFERAIRRGEDKERATRTWTVDVAYIAPMGHLIAWCYERGIDVKFVTRGGGVYYPEDKVIKISGRIRPMSQLHFLLHECGHHLIGDRDKRERFGMGYNQVDHPNIKRTFHHRVDIVDEEFEAWQRGWKLAQRLGLRISKVDYDRTRVEMLRTYMKWALKVDGYGKEDDDDDEDENTEASTG